MPDRISSLDSGRGDDPALAEARRVLALAEKATLGPWYPVGPPWNDLTVWINAQSADPHQGQPVCDFDVATEANELEGTADNTGADAAAIIAAVNFVRDHLPALLARVEAGEAFMDLFRNGDRNGCCVRTIHMHDFGPWVEHANDCPLAAYDALCASTAPLDALGDKP